MWFFLLALNALLHSQNLHSQCDSAPPRWALTDLLNLYLISCFLSGFFSLMFVFHLSGWRHASAVLIVLCSTKKATALQIFEAFLSVIVVRRHIRTVILWILSHILLKQTSLFSESRSCWIEHEQIIRTQTRLAQMFEGLTECLSVKIFALQYGKCLWSAPFYLFNQSMKLQYRNQLLGWESEVTSGHPSGAFLFIYF